MRQENRTGRRGTRSRALIAGGIIALTGTVAACGSTASPGTGSAAPSKPKVSLSVTVDKGVGQQVKHYTLTCDPAGGTHPDPAAACRALMKVKHPFATVPAGHMCPMILASAKRAVFSGTYFGEHVHRTIIDGGCDLGRWTKLGQIVN